MAVYAANACNSCSAQSGGAPLTAKARCGATGGIPGKPAPTAEARRSAIRRSARRAAAARKSGGAPCGRGLGREGGALHAVDWDTALARLLAWLVGEACAGRLIMANRAGVTHE